MNSKSNESGYSSFEAGLNNLSLGTEPPHLPRHQYMGQLQQQQQWTESDDEGDDQPLSYAQQQQQQQQRPYSRPVSIRNMATNSNSSKPANFIKPAAPQSNKSVVPQDMHIVQDLYEHYSQKVYLEGYIYKKNDLTVDGKSFGDPVWAKLYVELCGPVLTLWDTTEGDENVMPQYINITDSTVEIIGHSGEPGRENVFSLNSAGANRYLFDVSDYNTLLQWVCAIRLSCFESSKLQEIYSRNFITRSMYADLLSKPINKMEGFVQVRFSGTTEWQKYWVVVSDRKEEKKLFGKKSVQSKGQMMFYETKKSKTPVMIMNDVVHAYTIYPEAPQMIDLATMLKVEGKTFTVKSNGDQFAAAPTTALLMASSTKELVQWMVGTFDAFKLYGRPERLLEDISNVKSLNFAQPYNGNLPRLFLEVPDVIHIDYKNEDLISNKDQFASILSQKLQQRQQQRESFRQSQQPMGLIHQIPGGGGNTGNQSPTGPRTPNVQRMAGYPNQQPRSLGPQQQQQQQQRLNQPPGRVIYASDEESGEDEDESDNESADSTTHKNITRESLTLPALSTGDEGFASSIFDGIEKNKPTADPSNSPLPTRESNTTLPIDSSEASVNKGKQPANNFDFSGSEEEEEEEIRPSATNTAPRRPKPKMAPTQVSLSGSDSEEDEEEDDEEGSYSGSDDGPVQGRNPQDQHLAQNYMNHGYQFDEYGNPMMQQWDQNSMYPDEQGYYDEHGYPLEDEDGPIIPQLGDRFATQNSLLDSYRPDHPSARDQEGFARANGQPLIQVPNKPPEPRAGLVGMISQIEQEKKYKESSKNRFGDIEKERMMDRERERYIMEQRSQMMVKMKLIAEYAQWKN